MKIEMAPTVNSWDIKEEFGIRVLDCDFTHWAENDSYVSLELGDGKIQGLQAEIEKFSNGDPYERKYAQSLRNELDLVNKFRAMGYTERIFVYISW